jgi:hypothetical protein
MVAVALVGWIAVSTLRSSQEGSAPPRVEREVVRFPDTPNAVIGVVDDADRLTSLAVLTLDPSGVGGSVVVVPVNVDESNGFGPVREPLSRQPFAAGDPAEANRLASALEPLLTLTIERAEIVGPDELAALLEPSAPYDIELDEPIVSSTSSGFDVVIDEGTSELDADAVVDGLTAIDGTGQSHDHHSDDVEIWRAIASGGDAETEVPRDDLGRPIPPEGVVELWERMMAGKVGVRDLDIDEFAQAIVENTTGSDFVIVDRPDALLVFGAVSPALVTTPNESLSVSLVVGFDPDDVTDLGEEANGSRVTKTSMTRRFIRELLFAQANVIGVDLADEPDGVPERTQLYVTSEEVGDDARTLNDRFFADAEVIVADRIVDGVDVVAVLGEEFLVQRAELLELEREIAAEEAAAANESDFGPTGTEAADDDESG